MTKVTAASGFHSKDDEISYKLWEVATAITAMCIRSGKAGSWSGLDKTTTRRTKLELRCMLIFCQEQADTWFLGWANLE